jgi:hypothetical protein
MVEFNGTRRNGYGPRLVQAAEVSDAAALNQQDAGRRVLVITVLGKQ